MVETLLSNAPDPIRHHGSGEERGEERRKERLGEESIGDGKEMKRTGDGGKGG